MKKKLLFVMNDLNCGGSQKALISLLETLDYSICDVDLLLFSHEGMFLDKLPKEVNLLEEPEFNKYFDMSIGKALLELVKRGKFKIAFFRILAGLVFKFEKDRTLKEQKAWKYQAHTFSKISTVYDAAIGFQEKKPVYFCVDKVQSKIKIGWVHTDYSKIGIDSSIEKPYFDKLDYIVTVANELVGVLTDMFPDKVSKFVVIHNIVSSKTINRLSMEKVDFPNYKKGDRTLVSMGRLVGAKGFEIAIEACSILKKHGFNIKWYVIGEGGCRESLETLIRKMELQDTFILLGQKENPYPYMKKAEIYVQTSVFEGKSLAIDEAKILCKPIITTNFTSAKNQIQHMENGIISEIDALSVAKDIEYLLNNTQLLSKFVNNLKGLSFSNENEVSKFYTILNNH